MKSRIRLRPRHLFTTLRLIAGLFIVLVVLLVAMPWAKAQLVLLDLQLLDQWFRLRSLLIPEDSFVVILKEDDHSARELGVEGALYKKYHPEVVRKLMSEGSVRVIAFDHDFTSKVPDDDSEFAKMLGEYGKRIVIGSGTTAPAFVNTGSIRGYLDIVYQLHGIAHSTKIVRFVRIARVEDSKCVPSLGLASMVAFYFHDRDHHIECGASEIALKPSFKIPIDDQGLMMINFVGPAGTIPSLSYVDVVTKGANALRELRSRGEKIVLIGVTSEESQIDMHETPYGPMQGVELHANILHTLLQQGYIHRLSSGQVTAILICLGALGCLLVSVIRRLRSFLWAVGITVGGILILSFGAFAGSGWIEAVTYSAIFVGAMVTAWVVRLVRILPQLEVSKWHEIGAEFLAGSLVGLFLGHGSVLWALVVGTLTPIGIYAIGRLRKAEAVVATVILCLLPTAVGEARVLKACGKVGTILEEGVNEKGERTVKETDVTNRIVLARAGERSGDVKRGFKLFSQDELSWAQGVSFSVEYAGGTVQIYRASKKTARLTIECQAGSLTTKVAELIGTIRTFVQKGTTLSIPIDGTVTAGTRQTAFDLEVDSEAKQLVIKVWQGQVRVGRADGSGVSVGESQRASVAYAGSIPSVQALRMTELQWLKLSVAGDARAFGVTRREPVKFGIKAIEDAIARFPAGERG